MMNVRTFKFEISHNALDMNAGEPMKHLLNVLCDAHHVELDLSGNRIGNSGTGDMLDFGICHSRFCLQSQADA